MSATALSKASKAAFPASSVDILVLRVCLAGTIDEVDLLGWASSTALMMLEIDGW